MLNPLALQEIPNHVLSGLRSLSQHLPQHLSSTLGAHYERMLDSKLKPAQTFCNLLERLVRANESGMNASKILGDPGETLKMRDDWTRFVDAPVIVAREVPCGTPEAGRIMGEEVIQLLTLGDTDTGFEIKTEDGATSQTRLKPDEILMKWAEYLNSLPARFPQTPARLFLLCMSALLTAALREISISGGEGFGAWWVVRCWIDEWMGWSAELGGFLAAVPSGTSIEGVSAGTTSATKSQDLEAAKSKDAIDPELSAAHTGLGTSTTDTGFAGTPPAKRFKVSTTPTAGTPGVSTPTRVRAPKQSTPRGKPSLLGASGTLGSTKSGSVGTKVTTTTTAGFDDDPVSVTVSAAATRVTEAPAASAIQFH